MYRLKLHILDTTVNGDYNEQTIRYRYGDETQNKVIKWKAGIDSDYSYCLFKKTREFMRNILYVNLGNGWRKPEIHNSKYIFKSIISACKRMK